MTEVWATIQSASFDILKFSFNLARYQVEFKSIKTSL